MEPGKPVVINLQDAVGSLMLRRECPCCSQVTNAPPYDIGSGPEFCCPTCETCWGAYGQRLDPTDPFHMPREAIEQLPEWARPLFHATD